MRLHTRPPSEAFLKGKSLWAAVLLLGWCGAPLNGLAAEAADEDAPAAVPPARAPVKPRLSLRVRAEFSYREQGEYSDSDLYGRLIGSAYDLHEGRLDVYLSGRLNRDLDQPSSTSFADDPYAGLDDADGVTENRLLQLYGEIHDRQKRVALRAGRQYVDMADYLHIDGAQAMLFEEEQLGGRVYFGQPVSYYSGISGDLAGGVSVVGRPWEGNRTRLTLARYYDDSEDESDQNYYLDVRQNFSEALRARGQVSLLNEEFRMSQVDLFYFSESGETDASVGGSYWGAFDARTRAYSPLYRTLGKQQPYAYVYTRLTQQVWPSVYVSPGVSLRFAESGDNDFYNRDYQKYDVALIYEPAKSFSVSLSPEYWQVREDDSFLGITGEMRYRHLRIWEISGGSSYAQYSYDTYSDISYTVNGGQTVFSQNGTIIEESPYVYTYFIRGKWRLTRRLIWRLQFDVEDNETEEDLAFRGRSSIEVRY